MGPCIVMYSSITNKMQHYTIVFITINPLHVSGGSSAHHQELKLHTQHQVFVELFLLLTAIVSEFQLSCVSSEPRHSYCAPLLLDVTNIENGYPPTLKKLLCSVIGEDKESVKGVKHAFRTQIHMEPRIRASIYAQNKAFQHNGCIFKANSPGQSTLSGENTDRVRACLKNSPKKSTPQRCFMWKHVRMHVAELLCLHLRHMHCRLTLVTQ